MTPRRSDKSRAWALLPSILVLTLVSCNDGRTVGGDSVAGAQGSTGSPPMDFGEIRESDLQPGSGSRGVAAASGPAEPIWGVVLMTFSNENHQIAARNMLRELPRIDRKLGGAWVHETGKGSMVVFGRYTDPQEKQAVRDLKWVRGIQRNNIPVFRRAMLGRVVEGRPAVDSPHSLRLVRERLPDVDPLYTVQVAVWGSFGGGITLDKAQRNANAYTRQLRAQGHEAFVYHDLETQLSMITVGLFGSDAVDAESGLNSPEIDRVMQQFPSHLVNGEIFNEPKYKDFPSRGTRVQKPQVVLVPE